MGDTGFEGAAGYFRRVAGGGRKVAKTLLGITVLARMAKAVVAGEYELAAPKIALVLGTLSYVVSPVDALPELILGPMGLSDDASMVAATLSVLAFEVAAFVEWEKGHVHTHA